MVALVVLTQWAHSAHGNMRGTVMPENDQSPARVARYHRFELSVTPAAEYANPFDAGEVRIEATFTAPSGAEVVVRAFWTQDFTSALADGRERLTPQGEPHWRVRFTPTQVGEHGYTVRAATPDGTTQVGRGRFFVEASAEPGFIRRSDDPRYFRHDDGSPYFAVGHNVCWWGDGGTYDYERYFDAMAANAENWTRIWMIHWNVALEAAGDDYPGLGRYHLGKAWQLDRIFDLAAERGIAVMLCLDSFNTLRIRQPYPAYDRNPYAVENGGFLERPEDFFADPRARELFRRRLDYLVARYASRTNLMAWEFWNEVDIIERYVSDDVVAWHTEMARYLREQDPYDHLITTSYANTAGDDRMWALEEMDFTQSHQYGARDIAESVRKHTVEKRTRFGKPHIFGEFGTDAGGPRPEKDPNGVGLHNGIWASAMSGGAGTAMLWWWDNYVEPRNLYYHFRALARFVEGVEWHRLDLRDADATVSDERLRPMGLQNDEFAVLWLQNVAHTWHRLWRGEQVELVRTASVELRGLRDGRYVVEWWDTWRGEVLRREEERSRRGILSLNAPEVGRDVAVMVLSAPAAFLRRKAPESR
jgi:hypothetical protein